MFRRLACCAALLVAVGSLVPAASASGGVSVLHGGTYRTRIFPDDSFTVPDAGMLTGRRVNLRQGIDYPACDSTTYSTCDGFRMLDQLDGFDLQPRVTIPFSGPIDVRSVNADTVFVQGLGGRTELVQVVWDPATNTLAGITNALLGEGSRYDIVVTSGVKDTAGNPIDACGGPACVASFTTRTATAVLDHVRRALDDGSAYDAAGIANRKLGFVQNGTPDVFHAASVAPSLADPLNGMVRLDQTTTDPAKLEGSAVPNLIPPGEAGWFAFGSFESPRYQYTSGDGHHDDPVGNTDGVIPAVPTKQSVQPFGKDRLAAILVLPSGTPPAGGWPVAIYGPGFTRSAYDIFVSADHNAAAGIATIATDPAGHAFGPNSKTQVTAAGVTTTFMRYGRGRDLDGDGFIADGLADGVGPTDHKTVDKPGDPKQKVLADLPSHKPVDGLQSGLIQTVVDDMALARAIRAGVDVPGVGTDLLSHTNISYFGISFGGIYGTMLMGVDPAFKAGLLNVPGGPIVDIARTSGFRHDLRNTLAVSRPNPLNGGPGLDGFTESIPRRGAPPITDPYPGAIQLQESFAAANWYDRSGSPESFTPLLRLRPLAGVPPKKLLFQTAFGDQTVPNPTAGTIYRAGQIFDLVTYYRNDRTPTYASDPHGWLADPTKAGRTFGQVQLATFLSTGNVVNPNPAWFEVPIAEISNLSCLHYPEPQTGAPPNPMLDAPGQGDCPHLAIDEHGGWLPDAAIPITGRTGSPAAIGGRLPATGDERLPLVALVMVLLVAGRLLRPARRR
ncbi:MAG: hypothetical protein JWO37_2610 [Acidimicrobiales bacterium]|nr:hypothetical protein [Acidimicrobiales bacterium]